MEGIGLDNMLGAEEVEKMFSGEAASSAEETAEENKEGQPSENSEQQEAAEVDFSDLLGNQSESVGSEEDTEGNRGTPKSESDQGTPQANLFSSIAKALRDEGVFPDLSDDTLNGVKDAATLKKMFDDEISKSLDERQQKLERALNSGATPEEMKDYQNALNVLNFLDDKNTYDTLTSEGNEGENLRKKVLYQDYVNRGFSHEKAVKLIERSFADGSDIDDAKEAFKSCEAFYKNKVDDYQEELEERKKQAKAEEEKQYANLKKKMLDNESFFGGVKVDKATRQKAYDSITKPVFKDDQGNYLTALQKYQRENPVEFMENVAMLYALTDNFKTVEKLAKGKVKEDLKKGFAELETVLNSSRRNGDGTLNLANSAPDDSEKEKWTLAI